MIVKKYYFETTNQYLSVYVTEVDNVERTELLKEIIDFSLSNSRITVDSEILTTEPERTVCSLISNNLNALSIYKYSNNNEDENQFVWNETPSDFESVIRSLKEVTGYLLTKAIVID